MMNIPDTPTRKSKEANKIVIGDFSDKNLKGFWLGFSDQWYLHMSKFEVNSDVLRYHKFKQQLGVFNSLHKNNGRTVMATFIY